MIRGLIFTGAYFVLSVFYVLMATLSIIFPGRFMTRWIVRRYSQRMITAMRWFAGIKVEYRGLEILNSQKGAFILAPKHQSWGDGFFEFQ